ncbi:MAG: hypothetical protein M0R06_03580 [Sphaerochaeta sp.]|jgi:hypothetical protein|nr:hypothetical protein [Sphaerochaeta sp.]
MATVTRSNPELYTVKLSEYQTRFGEYPQKGHYLAHPDGQRAGAVVEVEAVGAEAVTLLVAWQERKPRTKRAPRKTVHHVNTAKKHGLAWLVAQDTMIAVNAVYAG